MKKREDRLELGHGDARRRSSRRRAGARAGSRSAPRSAARLARRPRARLAGSRSESAAWTTFAGREARGREHRHRVAERREHAADRRAEHEADAEGGAEHAHPARALLVGASRRRCRRTRRRCSPRRRRPATRATKSQRQRAREAEPSSASAVPAIVTSITGRRPMRSESRPQSGAHTNCAAA